MLCNASFFQSQDFACRTLSRLMPSCLLLRTVRGPQSPATPLAVVEDAVVEPRVFYSLLENHLEVDSDAAACSPKALHWRPTRDLGLDQQPLGPSSWSLRTRRRQCPWTHRTDIRRNPYTKFFAVGIPGRQPPDGDMKEAREVRRHENDERIHASC